MAWYWEYGNDGFQTMAQPLADTLHQQAEKMEMDMGVAAGRPPAPTFMRFLCKTETDSRNKEIELSPASKRSIHNLFCLDNVTSIADDPKGHACTSLHAPEGFRTTEHDPEVMGEPPAGAEEIHHDDDFNFIVEDIKCSTPKRQRVSPF